MKHTILVLILSIFFINQPGWCQDIFKGDFKDTKGALINAHGAEFYITTKYTTCSVK